MDRDSAKSIRNSVIASVIAGVILLSIPAIRSFLWQVLERIGNGFLWVWNWTFTSHAAPGWVWLIVSFFAVMGASSLYHAIQSAREQPEHERYVEAFIRGAIWRWSWAGNSIVNLWGFCPTCEAVLVYDDSSCRTIFDDQHRTDFCCENCEKVVTTIKGGSKNYAIDSIKREIDRRVRTGEYKSH